MAQLAAETLNPEYTYTVSKYQMASGIFDTMSHLMEQYFFGTDDTTTDYLIEGAVRSLIHGAGLAAISVPYGDILNVLKAGY